MNGHARAMDGVMHVMCRVVEVVIWHMCAMDCSTLQRRAGALTGSPRHAQITTAVEACTINSHHTSRVCGLALLPPFTCPHISH